MLTIRLNGAEWHDLKEYAREQGWDVSERTLWRYIAAADDKMEEHFETSRKKLLRRHILQRRMLQARAIGDGDWRTALAIAKDEAELERLYPEKMIRKKVEHSGQIERRTRIVIVDESKQEKPDECPSSN